MNKASLIIHSFLIGLISEYTYRVEINPIPITIGVLSILSIITNLNIKEK